MLTLTGAPDLKVYDSLLTGGWRGCDDGHRRHAGTHRCLTALAGQLHALAGQLDAEFLL